MDAGGDPSRKSLSVGVRFWSFCPIFGRFINMKFIFVHR